MGLLGGRWAVAWQAGRWRPSGSAGVLIFYKCDEYGQIYRGDFSAFYFEEEYSVFFFFFFRARELYEITQELFLVLSHSGFSAIPLFH